MNDCVGKKKKTFIDLCTLKGMSNEIFFGVVDMY